MKPQNYCMLPTPMGNFRMYDYEDESIRVVCMGAIEKQGKHPLLRMHSSCLASEVFGATDCDCADQLREAMKLIATEGAGIIVHLHQEGRGQGLSKKIQAISQMQRDNLDTFEAFERLNLEQDIRQYDAVVDLLRQLGINSVRLISNNPRKAKYLQQYGITVTPVRTHPNVRPENAQYLHTKNDKLGHLLPLNHPDDDGPIHFYHSDQPWGEFSNFSKHAIFLYGKIWPTVEHYYQAQKLTDEDAQEHIRRCATPMLAKTTATEQTSYDPDWDTRKELVMMSGLQAKFTQHPNLRILLLGTKQRQLIERSDSDDYWGDGADGQGQNRLGVLLMQLRAQIHHAGA